MTVAHVETRRTPEPRLLTREVSEKAHGAIKGLVTDLLGTPEFTRAVVNFFFGRREGWIGPVPSEFIAGPLPNEVVFERGGFEYKVEYQGTVDSQSDLREHNRVRLRLKIKKYYPNQEDAEGKKPRKVARIHLRTVYDEDKEKKDVVLYRTGGHADFADNDQGMSENSQAVFDRISSEFDFSSPVNL